MIYYDKEGAFSSLGSTFCAEFSRPQQDKEKLYKQNCLCLLPLFVLLNAVLQ